MPPIARASWFRGVSAMPNTFAHECYVDELAAAAGVDPVEYRLRYLHDPRAVDLVHALAERAKWVPHTAWGTLGGEGDLLYGRGFAYAVYVHGPFPGKAAAWAAWVADVAVNKKTGEIAVTKVTCAQDSGMMINPDGVRHQIHGNIIQSTSRVLKEKVEFSSTAVQSKEWGGYPLITFPEVPAIDVLMLPRQDEPPLGVGESASVPSASAIANAVYDATGIRFRELPLTPELVLAALNGKRMKPLPPRPRISVSGGISVCPPSVLSRHCPASSPCPRHGDRQSAPFSGRIPMSIAPPPSSADGWRQLPVPAMCAMSAPTACPLLAADASTRLLGRSMPPISRRTPKTVLARGPIRPSSGPCARA